MKKHIILLNLITLSTTLFGIQYGPGPVKISPVTMVEPVAFSDGSIEINGQSGGPVIVKEDLSAAEIRAIATNLKVALNLPQIHLVKLGGIAQEITKDILNVYNELKATNKTDADHFLFRTIASLIQEADKKSPTSQTTASSVLNNLPKDLTFKLSMENKGGLAALINSLTNTLRRTMGQPRLEGAAAKIFNWVKTQANNARYRAVAQDFIILALVKVLDDNASLLTTMSTDHIVPLTPIKPHITPIGPERRGGLLPVNPIKPNIRPIGPERRPTTPIGPERGRIIPLKPVIIK